MIAAGWYLINGILHDIFVLRRHKGGYDRELLRLLMDGHVLLLSGAVLLAAWFAPASATTLAEIIGVIVAVGMLVYCGMIYPFLKSIVTMVISTVLLIVCLKLLLTATP